jgi:ADP-ribosylglycohydrolase
MLGGDSNANGCVAGAFLGCQCGFIGLPTHWVQSLREPQVNWINVRINLLLDMMGIP